MENEIDGTLWDVARRSGIKDKFGSCVVLCISFGQHVQHHTPVIEPPDSDS